jgi:hypothetical protein
MTAYIKLSTNEYPLYEGNIRLDYPIISKELTGDMFPYPEDYAPVAWTDMPVVDPKKNEYANLLPPILINNVWTTQWEIKTKTPEELAVIKAEQEALDKLAGLPNLTQSGAAPNVIS